MSPGQLRNKKRPMFAKIDTMTRRFIFAGVAIVAINAVASLAAPAKAATENGYCYDSVSCSDSHETALCLCEHRPGVVPDDCHMRCVRIGRQAH